MESVQPPEICGPRKSEAQQQSTVCKWNCPEMDEALDAWIGIELKAYQSIIYRYVGSAYATAHDVRFDVR